MTLARGSDWWPVALLILATLCVRGGVAWHFRDHLTDDRDDYVELSEQLAGGHGFTHPTHGTPTAYRPPLYPLALAGIRLSGTGATGIALFHLACGVATVLLTLVLGRRLGLGRACWVAAGLVAVDPLLTASATWPMTETLYTLLVVGWLVAVAGPAEIDTTGGLRRGILVGVLFGIAVLCRPATWVVGGLAIGAALLGRRSPRRFGLLAAIVAAALTVSPWAIRNAIHDGGPLVTTTHGGYTLLLGNNPVFYREVVRAPWGTVWNDDSQDSQADWLERLEHEQPATADGIPGERQRDSWMYRRARANMAADPGGCLGACWLRLRRLWNLAPLEGDMATPARLGVGLFYLVVSIAAIAGLVRRPWKTHDGWGLPLLWIVGLTLVHLLFWSTMRMRAPLVPIISLLAACGLRGTVMPPGGSSESSEPSPAA